MAVVLIADDEPVSRRMAALVLERHGHEVREARDGAEAIAVIEGGGVDVVVADLDMPAASGLDVLGRISELAPERRPAFVLLTGVAERSGIGDRRVDGVDRFLTKPVSSRDLGRCVEQLVAERKPLA